MQSIQSKATVQSRSSLGAAFKELKDQIKRATAQYEAISAIVKGPPHHGDSHSDGGSSSEGSNRVRATDIMTSMPQDETATWKHRCSEKLLLAHVMQLIKPDKMH